MKIHFTSLGCPRNLVDTELMLGLVEGDGHTITDSVEDADIVVVNTCGFLEIARQESLDVICELFQEKGADARIIVTGCMVQNHRELLQEQFPDIHYLLGAGDLGSLITAIESQGHGSVVTLKKSYLQSVHDHRIVSTASHYAYIKVAEGCLKRCSYCIIPRIKGPLRSRTIEDVVQESELLLSQGVYELILVAQDLGDFGNDVGQDLESLIGAVLSIDSEYWLRMLYLYPQGITDGLIEMMANDTRICRYIDIPLQHISDPILKMMGRPCTKKSITALIEKLRKAIPDIVIRTSLMVGFPGETEEHFEELLQFVSDYSLDNVGVFTYSQEELSPSSRYPEQVSEEEKLRRYEQLMVCQREIVLKKNKGMVGKEVDVLVDGYHPESDLLVAGRTRGQSPDVDGCVIINDYEQLREFGAVHRVQITDIAEYDFIGKIRA